MGTRTMRELESAILAELKTVSGNKKLRQKDIMAWQTGKTLRVYEGETLFYLPKLKVSVAVKIAAKLTRIGRSDRCARV